MQSGAAVETATIGLAGVIGASTGLGVKYSSARIIVQLPGTAAWLSASQLHTAANGSQAIRDLIVRYIDLLLAAHTEHLSEKLLRQRIDQVATFKRGLIERAASFCGGAAAAWPLAARGQQAGIPVGRIIRRAPRRRGSKQEVGYSRLASVNTRD